MDAFATLESLFSQQTNPDTSSVPTDEEKKGTGSYGYCVIA
jgi:hypothetical protein